MPIKTILVVLDTEARAQALTQTAASVAKAFSAHLIGLHVLPNAFVPSLAPVEATGELIEAQREANEAAAKRISDGFNRAIAGLGVPFEWRRVEANYEIAANVVMRHGREADLVILGQPDTTVNLIDGIALAEEVMLGLGRPVLMVPKAGAYPTIGKRVLLAWNGSRESARATFDALPFLEKAESVRILAAEPPPRRRWAPPPQETSPTAGIATTLERHGVRCTLAKATAAGAEVGKELLAQAKQNDCDLIVMGGYGHWRINEIVFGGATRGVFDDATLPVLLSH